MGIVKAVCLSKRKGVAKKPVAEARLIEKFGMEDDAHAGNWHRQVSLLSDEKIQAFKDRGAIVSYGCFGENIVVSGIDFATLPVGTLLRCGEIELEISQIGKECHDKCQIFHTMGECIMPTQGVFAVVLHGGTIKEGDVMELVN